MSKVLVDRELLSVLRSCTLAWAAEYQWRNNLREIHEDHKDAVERAEAILAQPDDQASSETSLDTPLMIQRLGNRNKRIDELEASLSAVTAERDRLLQELAKSETNTMALMVKHFAGSMSNREQDRKLDECLSEGIAMLEAERDQYRDMAGCMDLLRRDMIEAGIVGESCPPMFMTEGVLAHIAKLRAEVTALQANSSRYAHLKAAWDDDVLISYLDSNVHPSDWDRVIDAAMAAKEA